METEQRYTMEGSPLAVDGKKITAHALRTLHMIHWTAFHAIKDDDAALSRLVQSDAREEVRDHDWHMSLVRTTMAYLCAMATEETACPDCGQVPDKVDEAAALINEVVRIRATPPEQDTLAMKMARGECEFIPGALGDVGRALLRDTVMAASALIVCLDNEELSLDFKAAMQMMQSTERTSVN